MDSLPELESLLREALAAELRHRRGTGTVNRLEEIRRVCHETYTNPANWTQGALIELRERGTDAYVGTFREYLHKKVNARKLTRETAADEPLTIQYVEGELWLGGPFQHVVDPPTEGELAAIRAYWKPQRWRPAWLHLKRGGPLHTKTGDELLEELMQ